MWIVRLALRRPYSFTIMALMIVLMGVVAITRMSTDIFPAIDIPVVSVVWSYTGVSPEEMEKRFVTITERAMTTTVNDIEHIESQSYNGTAVIKVFFHEGAKVEAGVAQVTSICQTLLRQMPQGTTPPLIIRFSASNVPILQLSLSGSSLSEQQLYDFGLNFIRTQLSTVQGAQIPLPYGGKVRQIMVDLDPEKLWARGLSGSDISSALNVQNLILPAGTQKIGDREYNVRLNSSPEVVEALNDLPVKMVNGTVIYMRDVAQVRDGFAVQQNVVLENNTKSALLTVLKNAKSSTLDILQRVKTELPRIQATLPAELKITQLFDQGIFVRASVNGVLKEGVIAACLTALMILLFLGSWRSTLVVVTSIPLSILCSIILLAALGETLNIMTLGGLALAVGILVDDATVEIENIHRNLAQGKPMVRAILDGAQQIAIPAFVSTLCICIVFVPVFFLSGTAKYLFQPLALAVIFAMLASYFLSRTVVPTMVQFLLKNHPEEVEHSAKGAEQDDRRDEAEAPAERPDRPARNPEPGSPAQPQLLMSRAPLPLPEHAGEAHFATPAAAPAGEAAPGRSRLGGMWRVFSSVHHGFNRRFERLRHRYTRSLDWTLDHRVLISLLMVGFVLLSLCLVPFLGRDFFPAVDSGQFRLHVRAPEGTRLEATEQRFQAVTRLIREVIPPAEIETVLANIGLPGSGINLSFSDSSTISSADGEILVSMREEHGPTAEYTRTLRQRLHEAFPDMSFYFAAPDIVTQILNFGLPAPIDIQVSGRSPENLKLAQTIRERVSSIRGAVDVRLHQRVHGPDLFVNVDRTRAEQIGLTQQNVASSVLVSLSSSSQAAPNFWLNYKNGVNYQVAVQTPQYRLDSLNALQNTPIIAAGLTQPQLLGNLALIERRESPVIVNHYNVQPVFDVLADAQERDLGGVAGEIQTVLQEFDPKPHWLRRTGEAVGLGKWMDQHQWLKTPPSKLPRGTVVTVRGQVESMNKSFLGLAGGLVFAIVLVYGLMVVNFQSWTDPLIIIMALPGALCGIVWMLFITGTTINVPSLMGAIMAIGVATANSILLVTFANDERCAGEKKDAREAALSAGHTRLRPVLMTALAMIIGMLPMSLGLGEGGEQNAPLGRAVIGGLLVATLATLYFVPVMYSVLRKGEFECEADEKFAREADEHHEEEAPHA